jgi:hypothetical protein
MKILEKDWLTESPIDFEYKKYVLLAYMQNVKKYFSQIELYPTLADLVFHYNHLLTIQRNQEILKENFPSELSMADFENWQLIYKKMITDTSLMTEIEDIIQFALPHIKDALVEGKNIYEYIEENIDLQPVGLVALNHDNGFLIVYEDKKKEANVFEYKITIFESTHENYRGIHTKYLETMPKNIHNTFENIKLEILRKHADSHNSTTYLAYSKLECPLNSTLLPIAKRQLVKSLMK